MKFTDAQIAKIIADMVILCDTRENKNQHMLDYLKSNGIKHRSQKLDSADYSFELPSHQNLNLDLSVLVERKNSLDEIIGNLTSNRDRFIREFERMNDNQIRHIIVENATWKKLFNGSYRSQASPKSITASLLTWNVRYNCPIWFANQTESPELMYNLLVYGLREKLKEME